MMTETTDLSKFKIPPSRLITIPEGLGQAHPHIDLSKFVGQEVYIELNVRPSKNYSDRTIGVVKELDREGGISRYNISGWHYTSKGIQMSNSSQHILRVFPTNAFEVITGEVEKPPIDPAVAVAREALSHLTQEQIGELWELVRQK